MERLWLPILLTIPARELIVTFYFYWYKIISSDRLYYFSKYWNRYIISDWYILSIHNSTLFFFHPRCNFSLILLSEVIRDQPRVNWLPHLPLLLHVVFLGKNILPSFPRRYLHVIWKPYAKKMCSICCLLLNNAVLQ
jgi:hypothetical protein